MKTNAWTWAAALACLAIVALAGCVKPFPSASYLDKQRFLAVIADPLEAAPGEQISFSAVVANKDGSRYAGPIAWAVVTGAMLREEGQANIDPNDVHRQTPDEPAFVWTVPSATDLRAKFGPPEKNGYLVTIAATAFANGDPNGAQISAFKLFVISDKPAAQRAINPTIQSLDVLSGGRSLAPDADDRYEAPGDSVTLEARPERDLGALTYHWFATDEDFSPDLDAKQKFAPGDHGAYSIYLVLRQSYFFRHDDSTSTRVAGEDWRRIEVVFGGH